MSAFQLLTPIAKSQEQANVARGAAAAEIGGILNATGNEMDTTFIVGTIVYSTVESISGDPTLHSLKEEVIDMEYTYIFALARLGSISVAISKSVDIWQFK